MLKIKELRKEKKISQFDLAQKIEVSVRMFAEYENETADIPLKKLQKIADALEVNFFDLFIKKENDFDSSDANEAFNQLNEPREIYGLEKKETIQVLQDYNQHLKEEIADLKSDKQLLSKIIELKLH